MMPMMLSACFADDFTATIIAWPTNSSWSNEKRRVPMTTTARRRTSTRNWRFGALSRFHQVGKSLAGQACVYLSICLSVYVSFCPFQSLLPFTTRYFAQSCCHSLSPGNICMNSLFPLSVGNICTLFSVSTNVGLHSPRESKGSVPSPQGVYFADAIRDSWY